MPGQRRTGNVIDDGLFDAGAFFAAASVGWLGPNGYVMPRELDLGFDVRDGPLLIRVFHLDLVEAVIEVTVVAHLSGVVGLRRVFFVNRIRRLAIQFGVGHLNLGVNQLLLAGGLEVGLLFLGNGSAGASHPRGAVVELGLPDAERAAVSYNLLLLFHLN